MQSLFVPFALGASAVQAAMVETAPHRIHKQASKSFEDAFKDDVLNTTAGRKRAAGELSGDGGANWGLTDYVVSPWLQVDLQQNDTVLFNTNKSKDGGDPPNTLIASLTGHRGKLTTACGWEQPCSTANRCEVKLDDSMKTTFFLSTIGTDAQGKAEDENELNTLLNSIKKDPTDLHGHPALLWEDFQLNKKNVVYPVFVIEGTNQLKIVVVIERVYACHPNLYPATFVGWENSDNMHAQFIQVSLTMHEYRLTFNHVENEHMLAENEVADADLLYKESEIVYHNAVFDAQAMNAVADLWQLASRLIAAVIRQAFIEEHIAPPLMAFDGNAQLYSQHVANVGKSNDHSLLNTSYRTRDTAITSAIPFKKFGVQGDAFAPKAYTMLKQITESPATLSGKNGASPSNLTHDWNDPNAADKYVEDFGRMRNPGITEWQSLAGVMSTHGSQLQGTFRQFYGLDSLVNAADLHAARIHFESYALDLMGKMVDHFEDVCNDRKFSMVLSTGALGRMCDEASIKTMLTNVKEMVQTFKNSERWESERAYDDTGEYVHELVGLAGHIVKAVEKSLRSSDREELGSYIRMKDNVTDLKGTPFAEFIVRENQKDKYRSPTKVFESAYKYLLILARETHLNYFSTRADLSAAHGKCDEVLSQKLRVEIQLNDAMTILQELFDQVRWAYSTFHRQGVREVTVDQQIKDAAILRDASGIVKMTCSKVEHCQHVGDVAATCNRTFTNGECECSAGFEGRWCWSVTPECCACAAEGTAEGTAAVASAGGPCCPC